MKLNKLVLKNFRNYKELDLNFDKRLNIFFGKNAQGKTSILEAIYYLSLLTSYRTSQDSELINYNEQEFQIYGLYQNIFRENNIKVFKNNTSKKRECSINDILLNNKEYIGEFKAVAFSPEDLEIIKGEPMNRRRFINIQISRINKYYYSLLVNFNAILKQRNKLLKDIRDGVINKNNICVWDVEYSKTALEVMRIRKDFFSEFIPISCDFYNKLSENQQEILTCEYKASYETTLEDKKEQQEAMLKHLADSLDLDIKRGSTGIGPHRDDFQFFINNYDVQKFASQGQQRSIILSMKLAEILYINLKTNEYPILLLDDVLSELDENKKEKLLKNISEEVQVFVTVTETRLLPEKINELSSIEYFEVVDGVVNYNAENT